MCNVFSKPLLLLQLWPEAPIMSQELVLLDITNKKAVPTHKESTIYAHAEIKTAVRI